MTEYVLNNLNRSLTDYSGVQNSLYECINLLHSYQDSYNKERSIQTIEFNKINNARKANGLEACQSTTDTEEFIYKYHRIINQILESAHNTAINYLAIKKNKQQDKSYATYLDKKEIEILNKNSSLYNQIFAIENTLRKYIISNYTLNKWLKQEQLNSFSQRKE